MEDIKFQYDRLPDGTLKFKDMSTRGMDFGKAILKK
jgi:hypothetical protein